MSPKGNVKVLTSYDGHKVGHHLPLNLLRQLTRLTNDSQSIGWTPSSAGQRNP